MKISYGVMSLLLIMAFLVSCGAEKRISVKPTPPKKDFTKITFSLADIAPEMKIYGTGMNFYGVVPSATLGDRTSPWTSAGNPPHWLIFDGKGEFEGIEFKGLFNVNKIHITFKNDRHYPEGFVLSNLSLSNGCQLKFTPYFSTNLIPDSRIKIEFSGTNISVSNILIYGKLSPEKDFKIAENYKMSKKESVLLKESGLMFNNKDFNRAIQLNEQAIRENPENPYPYMNLGQIYQALAEESEEHSDFLRIMNNSMENYAAAERPDNPARLELTERMAKIYQYNLLDQDKAQEIWKDYAGMMKQNDRYDGNKMASVLASGITGITSTNDTVYETTIQRIIDLVNKGEVDSNNLDVERQIVFYCSYLLQSRKEYKKVLETARLLVDYFGEMEAADYPYGYEFIALADMALGNWQEAANAWKGAEGTMYPNKEKLFGMALTSLYSGNYEKARKLYLTGMMWMNDDHYKKFETIVEQSGPDKAKMYGSMADYLKQQKIITSEENIKIDLIIRGSQFYKKYNIILNSTN